MKWIKKNITTIITSVIGAVVTAIIMEVLGIINFVSWLIDLFEKILEYKLIAAIIIVIIIIIKVFPYIRKFLKWLLMKCFKFAWKIIGDDLIIFAEDLKREKMQAELKSNFDSDLELEYAIDTYFSDGNKKQTFIDDYIREKQRLYENDPDTWAVIYRFQKEKGMVEFIKYLEGFFEALIYWDEKKLNNWTKLSIMRKEAEFLECMKHIDSGKLKEFQEKCARFQSIIPEKVYFLDPQNFIR